MLREIAGLARADDTAPPEAKAVCSLNGFFCAVMDPEQKLTIELIDKTWLTFDVRTGRLIK